MLEEKKIETTKAVYVTPEIKKHKAASIVSGSGCSYYSERVSGGTYYW
jgi:hypothetical protein